MFSWTINNWMFSSLLLCVRRIEWWENKQKQKEKRDGQAACTCTPAFFALCCVIPLWGPFPLSLYSHPPTSPDSHQEVWMCNTPPHVHAAAYGAPLWSALSGLQIYSTSQEDHLPVNLREHAGFYAQACGHVHLFIYLSVSVSLLELK